MTRKGEASCFADETMIALKRDLVTDDYSSAHSCDHCRIFAVPTALPSQDSDEISFFHKSMKIADIHSVAESGCRWFWLLSNKLRYDARVDYENMDEDIVEWESMEMLDPPGEVVEEGSVIVSMRYVVQHLVAEVVVNINYGHRIEGKTFLALKQPGTHYHPKV